MKTGRIGIFLFALWTLTACTSTKEVYNKSYADMIPDVTNKNVQIETHSSEIYEGRIKILTRDSLKMEIAIGEKKKYILERIFDSSKSEVLTFSMEDVNTISWKPSKTTETIVAVVIGIGTYMQIMSLLSPDKENDCALFSYGGCSGSDKKEGSEEALLIWGLGIGSITGIITRYLLTAGTPDEYVYRVETDSTGAVLLPIEKK